MKKKLLALLMASALAFQEAPQQEASASCRLYDIATGIKAASSTFYLFALGASYLKPSNKVSTEIIEDNGVNMMDQDNYPRPPQHPEPTLGTAGNFLCGILGFCFAGSSLGEVTDVLDKGKDCTNNEKKCSVTKFLLTLAASTLLVLRGVQLRVPAYLN